MEHSCHVCGSALGHIRAPLDPVYHLAIVICPACDAPVVRRRHPLVVLWRSVRRWFATLLGLGWRLLASIVAIAVSMYLCETLSDSLNSLGPRGIWHMAQDGALDIRWFEDWKLQNGPIVAAMSIAWCLALGAALTAGFGHLRRRWVLWAVFFSAILAFHLLDGVGQVGALLRTQSWADARSRLATCFWQIDRSWGWYLIGMLLAVPGMPIGRALRRAFSRGDIRRFAARRRRARLRRFAT